MNKPTETTDGDLRDAAIRYEQSIRHVERSAITLLLVRRLPRGRAVSYTELTAICDAISRGDHLAALTEPVTGIDHGRD